MSIPNAFRMLDRRGFVEANRVRNGVVLATTSLARYRFDTLTPYRKQVLVNQQNQTLTEHIEIPRLTRDEVHAQLLHYANCGRFFLMHGTRVRGRACAAAALALTACAPCALAHRRRG